MSHLVDNGPDSVLQKNPHVYVGLSYIWAILCKISFSEGASIWYEYWGEKQSRLDKLTGAWHVCINSWSVPDQNSSALPADELTKWHTGHVPAQSICISASVILHIVTVLAMWLTQSANTAHKSGKCSYILHNMSLWIRESAKLLPKHKSSTSLSSNHKPSASSLANKPSAS